MQLELNTGTVVDRYTIEDDCVDLTANHGAYLFDDMLAVLAVYTQEVHLLQILPSGRFIVLQHLGKHCWEDDNMVLSEQAHAEARWRRSQGLAMEELVHQSPGNSAAPFLERPVMFPPAPLQRAATAEDPIELPAGGDLQQGALAVLPILPEPAAGQPIILPLLAQAGLARADSAALSTPGVGPEDHMMIEGIKHRILAYLFKAHSLDGPSSDAVRKFFYDFQDYTDLIIWKAYFLVAYDWQRGKVLSFMDSQSEDMLMLYLRLTSWFHDGCMSSTWARHVTPCPFAFWCPGEQSTLRTYVPQQAAKRLMAGIPTSSHRLSLSPYLDAKLFMYDERLIEADLRLRTYSEQALKFTSLAHPKACRFKVQPIAPPTNPYQSTSRHLKQVVAYEFHPVEPLKSVHGAVGWFDGGGPPRLSTRQKCQGGALTKA
ncbi:g3393 [Coccomyxa viridis]|uniref:G3393 protein n=1 Tax=Coccomyxa viridis TaxID=1274662 RepID=A0ABP1FR41_9CHLO